MERPFLQLTLVKAAALAGITAAPMLWSTAAQACTPAQHSVSPGDTVFSVAETYYEDICVTGRNLGFSGIWSFVLVR